MVRKKSKLEEKRTKRVRKEIETRSERDERKRARKNKLKLGEMGTKEKGLEKTN